MSAHRLLFCSSESALRFIADADRSQSIEILRGPTAAWDTVSDAPTGEVWLWFQFIEPEVPDEKPDEHIKQKE